MSDSSDEEWAAEWIPYSQRNDWADVTPIAQDDGENPVVAIAYSAKCKFLNLYRFNNIKKKYFHIFLLSCSP